MFGKIIKKLISPKIETPKFVEPKVRADKFVNTFINLSNDTKTEISNIIREQQAIEDQFSNLFSTAKPKEEVKPVLKDDRLHLSDFLKNTFDPAGKKIKEELLKHFSDVKISINTVINIGSIMVNFQGREEYQYVIQLKAGKNVITTKVIVKESGERGGFDERLTLSGLTIEKIAQTDIIKDFLAGYKKHLARKGWV